MSITALEPPALARAISALRLSANRWAARGTVASCWKA